MRRLIIGLGLTLTACAASAQTPALRPDQTAYRAIYKELVETNTTLSVGSCTAAAEKAATRLKAAGYADKDLTLFSTPDHPKEGGLVAIFPGADAKAKPMLLLGHLDVVEAKREDWTRDPFTLIEEAGFFFGHGASDMKALDAIWIDTLINWKQARYAPKRTVKLALTCGEETTFAFNGAEWLAKNKRDLIDAEFALNEGGGGLLDAAGNRLSLNFQVGEKAAQNYTLEITNPGGHSSTPVKDNAITALATGLVKLGELEFPVQLSDTTRAYFAAMAKIKGGETREAVNALLAESTNKAADATLSKDRSWHSMLRTTCVATLLNAGHAENALPQRARANINCRIFPGTTVEDVRKKLEAQLADPRIAVTANAPIRPIAPPPPLSAKLLDPATKLAAKMWPGVPIVPVMSTGASDGIFLTAVGIPTYGVPGVFGEPDGGNFAHGLNERVRVRSVYEGRDFLQALVKAYAETP